MKMNVESFNLDHTKVKAPYIRAADTKTGANGDIDRQVRCPPGQTAKSGIYGYGGTAFVRALNGRADS